MGCCVSTSDKSIRSSPPMVSADSRAPPSVEEEKVKEVLSETPKWKQTVAKFEAEKKTVAKFEVEKKTVGMFEAEKPCQKPTVAKFEGESKVEKIMMALEINKVEEEISEVCSLSESVSTTTLTEEELRQRVHRSPAKINKNLCFSGEFDGGGGGRGKSPKRRTDQSPVRRNVKVVQSRDQMRNQPRRDNSDRRSMPPATRADNVAARSVVGGSQSARRTNQSPAGVGTVAPRNDGRKKESPAVEQSANESLENPLVSLECFIFL
ncbi:hypothetical protein TanjilG_26623 [Lupinus angustifolius]|uniref:Uncharacterized protein n=1 Tax=Lupinus angustifolius TaxID=3871 RepID=A0A4P1QPV3_LUPAN|nr:PREDICTED: uncharacterized protein LOC109333778 [Lupinus angustifolius]OIV91770.1 hypothetical protein TanjilG_26623 [Lupinus angustifolius]